MGRWEGNKKVKTVYSAMKAKLASLVGWLVGLFVGWLVGWLVGLRDDGMANMMKEYSSRDGHQVGGIDGH